MRHRDWHVLLDDFFRSRAETPFAWGTHDCCLFAADGVMAMTGADPCPRGLRGYATRRGADFRLARYGGVAGVAAHVCAHAGFRAVAPLKAGPGDPAVVTVDGVVHLGLVEHRGLFVRVAADTGMAEAPLAAAIQAWRVP